MTISGNGHAAQMAAWEADALIEALVEVGRPLTADERRIALCVCHHFTGVLADMQAALLEIRRLAG